jgi:hypothetical protein
MVKKLKKSKMPLMKIQVCILQHGEFQLKTYRVRKYSNQYEVLIRKYNVTGALYKTSVTEEPDKIIVAIKTVIKL